MKPKFKIGALLTYKYLDTKPEVREIHCKIIAYEINYADELCYKVLWPNCVNGQLQAMWWLEKNYIDVTSKLARLFYL